MSSSEIFAARFELELTLLPVILRLLRKTIFLRLAPHAEEFERMFTVLIESFHPEEREASLTSRRSHCLVVDSFACC